METTPRWSIVDAVVVLAVVLATSLFLPISSFNWFKSLGFLISPGNQTLGILFLNALFKGVLLAGLVFFFASFRQQGWARVALGLRSDEKKRWLRLGIGQGSLICLVVMITSLVLYLLFPYEVAEQEIVGYLSTAGNKWELFLTLAITSFFAPVSEEMYFRGFLYPALSKKLGRMPALILANIVFGILHLDLPRFLIITIGGIWLTRLYEKTGSLLTSITAHATWNASMILLLYLAG